MAARTSRRRLLVALALLVVAYVTPYVALRAGGSYRWSQSGRLRYEDGTGFAVTDVEVWSPRWATWEPFRDVTGQDTTRANLLGYLFSPLIRLDRWFAHPTRRVIEESSTR